MKKFPFRKLALILLISVFALCVPAVLSACGITYLASSCILAHTCASASKSCEEEQTTISYALTKDGDAYKVVRVGMAIDDVVIPETYEGLPVTTIAEGAFTYSSFFGFYATSFNSLTLPSTITTIEDGAFSLSDGWGDFGSSTFDKVYFNGNIEEYFNIYMGDRLLYCTETLCIDNEEIVDLVIPDGITEISPNAFAYYCGLNSVTLPRSLNTIGDNAFYNCVNLQELTLSENLQTIGNRAFYECSSFSSPLDFSKNLLSIGECAFLNCGTSRITFHEDIFLLIKENAFYGCSGIDSLQIPQGVRLGAGAFEDCTNLQSLKIASSTIGKAAFSGCISLCNIELADSVTVIEQSAFGQCRSLETLDLSQTQVQSIGEYAFEDCSLHLVYLPRTLEDISFNCFSDNQRLYEIYNLSNIEFSELSVVAPHAKVIHTSIAEPLQVECLDGWYLFDGENGWELFACEEYILSNYNVNLPETEHSYALTSGIFNNAHIWTVAIPSCVTAIGDNAFENCGELFEITFSEGLKSIGNYAFAYCPSIYKIILPEGLESVGDHAFAACPSLQYVNLPEGLISLGECAFSQSVLKTVTLPSTLTGFYYNVFEKCENLFSITVHSDNRKYYAENNCIIDRDSLTLIYGIGSEIPEGIVAIGERAFENGSISQACVPEGVTTIGEMAFYNCKNLFEVSLPSTLTIIEKSAFSQTGLLQIDIPGAVTEIGKNAFSGCNQLTKINVSEGVQNFNFEIFNFSLSLSELYLPKSVDLSRLLSDKFVHGFYNFTIFYEGTVEEWKQSASAEFSLLSYTIICSNGTVEYSE